jgi:hypothetical protein
MSYRRERIEIDESKITLQDLMIAIRIIEVFTDRIERARASIMKLTRLTGYRGEGDLYTTLLKEALRSAGMGGEYQQEPEKMSEEELQRIRELIKKESDKEGSK